MSRALWQLIHQNKKSQITLDTQTANHQETCNVLQTLAAALSQFSTKFDHMESYMQQMTAQMQNLNSNLSNFSSFADL